MMKGRKKQATAIRNLHLYGTVQHALCTIQHALCTILIHYHAGIDPRELARNAKKWFACSAATQPVGVILR
jgi:hypothetical protein